MAEESLNSYTGQEFKDISNTVSASVVMLKELANLSQTSATEIAKGSGTAVTQRGWETLTSVSDLLTDPFNRNCSRTSLRWRIKVILEFVKNEPLFYDKNDKVIEVELGNVRISVIDIVIGAREKHFATFAEEHDRCGGFENVDDASRSGYVAILQELIQIYQEHRMAYLAKKYELDASNMPIWNAFVEERNNFQWADVTNVTLKGRMFVEYSKAERLLTDIMYSSLSTIRKQQLLENKEILAWKASLDSRYESLLQSQLLPDILNRTANCIASDFSVFSAFVKEFYDIALHEERLSTNVKTDNVVCLPTTIKHSTGKQGRCCIT